MFRNVNLSNLKNVLQRNPRTYKVRECIFRTTGGTNFENFSAWSQTVASLWVWCMYRSAQKNSSTSLATLPSLLLIVLIEVEMKRFSFFMWSLDQGSYFFCGLEPLTLSDHCAKFATYRCYGSGDKTFLICHVISCDHFIKRTYDLIIGIPSNGDITFLFWHVTFRDHMIKETYHLVIESPST